MVRAGERLPRVAPEGVPDFATEDEEADFWSAHDSGLLMEQGEDVSDRPPAGLRTGPGRGGSRAPKRPEGQRMKLVSLYLPEELIAAVKQLATGRNLAYQALMRSWITERLASETAPSGTVNTGEVLRHVLAIEAMLRRLPITDERVPITDERAPVTDDRISVIEERVEVIERRGTAADQPLRSAGALMGSQRPMAGPPEPERRTEPPEPEHRAHRRAHPS